MAVSGLTLLSGLGGCTKPETIRKSAFRYFQAGNSAFLHRDYQSAIWNYQKAINLDSDTPEFHFNLGLAYYEIGNYPESLDAYQQVAEIRPDISDTYYNMALAYHKLEKSSQAELFFNRYQDMLSLRKARERAREKVKQAQARVPSSKPERAIATPNMQTRPGAEQSTHKKTRVKTTQPVIQSAKPTRNGQNDIPNWE